MAFLVYCFWLYIGVDSFAMLILFLTALFLSHLYLTNSAFLDLISSRFQYNLHILFQVKHQPMGAECCGQHSKIQSSLITSKPLQPISLSRQTQYIDQEGKPLPNAYKRYIKPPTTVGRQSIIVRNLRDNEDVPDWIWAANNQNILNSGNHRFYSNGPQFNRPYAQNRNTYELIEGHFKGVETVNLSKYPKTKLTGSEHPQPRNESTPLNRLYSVQPKSFSHLPGFANSHTNKPTIVSGAHQGSFTANLQPAYSFHDVPVVTSIDMNKQNSGLEMKMTESTTIQAGKYQQVQQGPVGSNYSIAGNKMGGGNTVHVPSGFSSRLPSVNNSVQHLPSSRAI